MQRTRKSTEKSIENEEKRLKQDMLEEGATPSTFKQASIQCANKCICKRVV